MKISDIKKIIEEERKYITAKVLFTSKEYKKIIENKANGIIRLFNSKYELDVKPIKLHIYWGDIENSVAFTTENIININANNIFMEKTNSKEEGNMCIIGLMMHELFHVLYTNFDLMYKSKMEIKNNNTMFPAPDIKNPKYEDIKGYLKTKKHTFAFISLYAFLDNCIEDAFIENEGMEELYNLSGNLNLIRDLHIDILKPYKDLLKEEVENGEIFTIIDMILQYAKFSIISIQPKDYKDERVQAFFRTIPHIDIAVSSRNSYDRKIEVNNIIVELWDFIKKYLDSQKEEVSEDDKEEVSKELEKELEKTMPPAAPLPEREGEAPLEAPSTKESSEPEPDTEEESSSSSDSSMEYEDDEEESGYGSGETPESKEMVSEKDIEDFLKKLSEKKEAEPKREDRASSEMSKLEKELAEKAAEEKVEEILTREKNEELKGITFDDLHSGVSSIIQRVSSVDDELVSEYEEMKDTIKKISIPLQRNVKRELEDKLTEDCLSRGFYRGSIIDTQAIICKERRCFKKLEKADEGNPLAVALRVDESGSMYGDRIEYARLAASILYDFCKGLDIPIGIYGDTADTGGYGVTLNNYASFNAYDNKDKYRLMDIQARSNNRDGYAIKYVGEQLLKQEAENKVLIIISDGAPAASGYYHEEAVCEMKSTMKKLKNKGVIIIAAAIGEDRESVKDIYGDAYMDISDMSKLPTILPKKLKKYLN